jgi:hypothetical protein
MARSTVMALMLLREPGEGDVLFGGISVQCQFSADATEACRFGIQLAKTAGPGGLARIEDSSPESRLRKGARDSQQEHHASVWRGHTGTALRIDRVAQLHSIYKSLSCRQTFRASKVSFKNERG